MTMTDTTYNFLRTLRFHLSSPDHSKGMQAAEFEVDLICEESEEDRTRNIGKEASRKRKARARRILESLVKRGLVWRSKVGRSVSYHISSDGLDAFYEERQRRWDANGVSLSTEDTEILDSVIGAEKQRASSTTARLGLDGLTLEQAQAVRASLDAGHTTQDITTAWIFGGEPRVSASEGGDAFLRQLRNGCGHKLFGLMEEDAGLLDSLIEELSQADECEAQCADEDDDPDGPDGGAQEITSAATSRNQVSSLVRLGAHYITAGDEVLDYGGGRYEATTEALRARGVTSRVFDPFNRPDYHNRAVLDHFRTKAPRVILLSNVLNVIKEESVRAEVLAHIVSLMDTRSTLLVCVYEGDRSGVGKPSRDGWQEHRRTADYVKEIEASGLRVRKEGPMLVSWRP